MKSHTATLTSVSSSTASSSTADNRSSWLPRLPFGRKSEQMITGAEPLASTPSNGLLGGFLGKYRGLAFAIGSLILVIVAVLSLNLYFSAQIERNTRIQEAATTQATLVQQMSRQLFIITSRYQKVLPYQTEKQDLERTMETFSEKLNAFANHGQITVNQADGSARSVATPSAYSPDGAVLITELTGLWQGYQDNVAVLFQRSENSQLELLVATEFVEENNDQLASLATRFAREIQRQSAGNLTYMRAAQIAGIAFALVMFFLTIFRTVRRLMDNDHQLELARKETQEILTTVREGLFLVDSHLIIGSQYSREMQAIFNTRHIAGRPLDDLLAELIDHQELSVIQDFLKLLFAPHIIEDLTGNLNPLERVEVAVTQEDGSITHKHLNFEFYRVMSDGQIEDILVSVRDITDQIRLEQELENTRVEGERNLDLLMSILKADTRQLRSFVGTALTSLNEINAILREPIRDRTDYSEKIQRLFTRVHRLKGDAYAIHLDVFARQAHKFEDALDDLRQVEQVEGMDFLPLTIRLDKLISQTEVLQRLSEQLTGASAEASNNSADDTAPGGDSMATRGTSAGNSLRQPLEKLVAQLSEELEKPAQLVASGLNEVELDENQARVINDVCVQLIRNSLVHGIETTPVRERKNKPATGRVDIRLAQLQDDTLELRLRDDGQGIDLQAVRTRLVEQGVATPETITQWTDSKLISAIFRPGFSTAGDVDMHAGRGVGMDVIREQIQSLGGRIRIQQIPGRFCEFEIRLPAATTETTQ